MLMQTHATRSTIGIAWLASTIELRRFEAWETEMAPIHQEVERDRSDSETSQVQV